MKLETERLILRDFVNDLLIGNCGIRMDRADAIQADIGYELDPNHWNHGYATEAAHAIVDFGFSRFGLHRVWSWCVADNLGSVHVLEKLGMRLEDSSTAASCILERIGRVMVWKILPK